VTGFPEFPNSPVFLAWLYEPVVLLAGQEAACMVAW
jgi:hypothetical protein